MIKILNKQEYLKIASQQTFKKKDNREANEFGCSSAMNCIINASKTDEIFFTHSLQDKVTFVGSISKDGALTFFVTNHLSRTNAHMAVREIKEALVQIKKRYKQIYVRVVNWYYEANRFVKLCGFELNKETMFYKIYRI